MDKMIIVDTREQLPVWNPEHPGILSLKLGEGDYTTPELINKAHIERKTGNDLYGSLIQGHVRFRKELVRAKEKGLKLAVFVECPEEHFIAKSFKGGYRLQTPPAQLRKMIGTISEKYGVEFVWCDGLLDFREKAEAWFKKQLRCLNYNK
jgi:ERCC4-type nuclease